MVSFIILMLVATIATTHSGLITPSPLIRAYAGFTPIVTSRPVGLVVRHGSGLEGRYVPDHRENLYDDGSYKPEPTPVRLAASPYGFVPAGSGLEGQYVPDNLERLYDDGSYRHESAPVPLAASPYGLVAAGSGLEGQYVPDYNDKLYDDGSYRHQYVVV